MRIEVNGQARELDGQLTVSALLRDMGLADRRVAVEVNEEIVPRSEHETHTLKEHDRVEVVHAIGGG